MKRMLMVLVFVAVAAFVAAPAWSWSSREGEAESWFEFEHIDRVEVFESGHRGHNAIGLKGREDVSLKTGARLEVDRGLVADAKICGDAEGGFSANMKQEGIRMSVWSEWEVEWKDHVDP